MGSAAEQVQYFGGYGWYTEYLDLRYRKPGNFNITQFVDRKSRVGETNRSIYALDPLGFGATSATIFRMAYFVKFKDD